MRFSSLAFLVCCTSCFSWVACATSNQAGAALSVPPSQDWDGIDGPWSTFWVQIGTPPQTVRLLPATSQDALWVPVPAGCTAQDPSDCGQSRTVFNPNTSSTWSPIGTFHLGLSQEAALGYNATVDNAECGNETFTLGLPGSGLPTINNSVVEGFATKDFYMGIIGLNPQGINLTNIVDPQPSILQSLKESGSIPSLSFGYTAGSVGLESSAYGSLTLGGYDASRFINNNLSFPFLADSSNFMVGVQSITTNAANNAALLTTGINALIDSLIPEIWLPQDACTLFEQAFSLTWNDQEQLYLLNDSAHNALVGLNPNITFQLGVDSSGGDSVKIVLPYSSFDLTVNPPLVSNTSRYFPLKRAQNSTQYVLGRTFLQSAYMITDYERSNFSISQAIFPSTSSQQHLVPILPLGSSDQPDQPGQPTQPSSNQPGHSSDLGGGAIAGIVIGVLAGIAAIIAAILLYRRRKNKKHAGEQQNKASSFVFEKAELDGTEAAQSGSATREQQPGRRQGDFYGPGSAELDNMTPGKVELSSGMASPAAELESDPASPYKDAGGAHITELGDQYVTPPMEFSPDGSAYPFPRSSTFGSHEMSGGNVKISELATASGPSHGSPELGMSSETRSDLESLRDNQISPDIARASQMTNDLESLRARQVSPDIAALSEPGSDSGDFRGRRASPDILYSPDASSYFHQISRNRGVSPYVPGSAEPGTDSLGRPHFRQDSGDGAVTPIVGSESPKPVQGSQASQSGPGP